MTLSPRCLGVLTRGLQQIATLPALLDDFELLIARHPDPQDLDGVLAWGRKPSASVAAAWAARHNLPIWRAEDGFLRSVGLGDHSPPLSLVLDDLGIYYDALVQSRLEAMVAEPHGIAQRTRAGALRDAWRAGRLSKYNHAREAAPPAEETFILAVDQTFGDASIAYGLANAASFSRMLEAALDEHPGLPVVLKVHPDVIAGRKRGHFDSLSPGQASRVLLLASDAHPPSLIEPARAVYTVTSQMGFEALIWGKPVRTFGMPFYAGWGLTQDELPAPERRRSTHRVTLEDLIHAALVEYPRYIDPETGKRCEPERLMEWMSLQRRMRERFPAQVQAIGFSRWKKPIVRAFFSGSDVTFTQRADRPAGHDGAAAAGATAAPAGQAAVAVWGRQRVPAWAGQEAGTLVRLEDGFLRSVGLGADLVRPLSWVMDRSGIYYDATAPSDLERLLSETEFDSALVERAGRLRERIAELGITKYNVGGGDWRRPPGVARVVLVPGQVESDASIRLGAPGLKSNLDLLRAARASAPGAHLVYKPHPDVVAKLRKKGHGEGRSREFCDEIVVDVPMDALLRQVDEVHVLTSLAGFEALLRGRRVVTWGCPFYAGWGLTEDHEAMPRRGRRLSLDELVAAVLILYPTYVSRTTGCFTTPERALEELAEWRARGASTMPAWRRALRPLLGLAARAARRA